MRKLINRLIWKIGFFYHWGFWPGPEQDRMADFLDNILDEQNKRQRR